MKVEIFTLCDAATTDAAGKLNILGSFDRLNATQTPVMHPQCALAIKLRFERGRRNEIDPNPICRCRREVGHANSEYHVASAIQAQRLNCNSIPGPCNPAVKAA
jgi:hypothetical protein